MINQRRNVLIVNVFSPRNAGDAAIFEGLVACLRRIGRVEITAAAHNGNAEMMGWLALGADRVVSMPIDILRAPSPVQRIYPLLAAWVFWQACLTLVRLRAGRPNEALKAYLEADLVVSCGGGYLGGGRPGANAINLFHIALARWAGRRCIVAPVTVKPASRSVRALLKRGLQSTVMFARDRGTADRMTALGLDCQLDADLALRSPTLLRASQSIEERPDRFVIGWAPRQFGPDHDAYVHSIRLEQASIDALVLGIRRVGASVMVFPQSDAWGLEDDVVLVEELRTRFPIDVADRVTFLNAAADLRNAVERLRQARVLLTSRLHAGLMSLALGRPALIVDYEAKVSGVLDQLGLPEFVVDPSSTLSASEILNRLIAADAPETRAKIHTSLAAQRSRRSRFDDAISLALAGSMRGRVSPDRQVPRPF